MAISEQYAVTATVGTTEWSFVTNSSGPDDETTVGVVQGVFDVAALAAGDTFRLRVYERARSATTQRVVYEQVVSGVQAEPIVATPTLVLMHGWDFTWTKIAGTDRSIIGSIRRVV
jgi:hypothetical protein